MGAKIKTQINSWGLQQNSKKSLDQNLTTPPPQKKKKKKNPMPYLGALKFPESIKWYNTKNKFLKTSLDVLYLLKYAGTTPNLQIVLNTQNNPKTPKQTKYTWQNFPLKKILEWKISNPNHGMSGIQMERIPPESWLIFYLDIA